MRINYEKALEVVKFSNPDMASDVQTCIDLFNQYAVGVSSKDTVVEYVKNSVIREAETALASHYAEYMAQVEAEKQEEAAEQEETMI